jgi:CDGSH-type Zn-finger protein
MNFIVGTGSSSKNGDKKEPAMPNITSAEKNGHIGHIIKLQPGEKIMLCRCYKSTTFPLCDLVHQKHEGTFGPLIVEAVKETSRNSAAQ